jgi:superfamily II DNA/RNA helicase
MSSATIKRHNHRVLPCNTERKIELINFLIKNNNALEIVIVSKEAIKDFKDISLNEKIKITTDSTFNDDVISEFDMLINYDLPQDPQEYLKRLELAKVYSFILLDPADHAELYPIETTLGRVLVQDPIKAFETTQSKEIKIAKAKKEKKEKRYEEELKKEKERKERAALKKLPPKRNVRKIASKKEELD